MLSELSYYCHDINIGIDININNCIQIDICIDINIGIIFLTLTAEYRGESGESDIKID